MHFLLYLEYFLCEDLIREVHKVLPDTAIWLGGPEVSYDARKVLEEHPEVTRCDERRR